MAINYDSLTNPDAIGVFHEPGFLDIHELTAIQEELTDTEKIAWEDTHDVYTNERGLVITQNHDTYALKLSRGDQSPLDRIPHIRHAMDYIRTRVGEMALTIPSLVSWEPDEMSLHRYDDAEIGLDFHKDNNRFTGLIAIVALDGICDIVVRRDYQAVVTTTKPGDLVLLRAPGLVDTTEDLRPEHAVLNLQTPTRTSLMVRANKKPDEALPNFHFANW